MAEKIGLTSAEAAARLQKNGRNELSKKQKSKLAGIILEQFKDYMVLVLIGAAILPISVCMPVAVTTARPRPSVTIVPI